MKYKAIGFDLGGVMIKYGVTDELSFIADELGVSQTALMDPYEKTKAALDAGQMSNREFWSNLVRQSGSTLRPEETMHLWTDNYQVHSPKIPGMLDLVDALKAQGYSVGMFSNIDAEHAEANRPRGIYEHFDPVIFSFEAKVAKPDPRAFTLLADRLGVVPDELIFIDDLQANIEGARQAGCYGIRFLDYQQLVEELEKIGIKV